MNKTKNFFTKEMKTVNLPTYWMVSLLSFVGLLGFLYNGYNGKLTMSMFTCVFPVFATFLVLLPFVVLNFKRRALYDPKLNMIDIFTFKELNQSKYLNRMFSVSADPSGHYYGMYLKYEASRPEDSIFLYFRPDEIEFSIWVKSLKEILGDQPVAGVSFIKEKEGDRIGIKFWTFSSDEGRVIYPLRSQW